MSASAAVLILVITILRALLIHKLPKKTFMILWGLALFRLLAPFSLPSVLSVYSWLPQQNIETANMRQPLPINELFPSENKSATPEIHAGYIQSTEAAASLPFGAISVWKLAWAAGFLACFGFFLLAYHRGISKFKQSSPIENPFIEDWKLKHPLWRKLSIKQSDQISAPLSYGLFRPVILLPQSWNRNDTVLLEYILTHELVHIRRFDILYKAVLILATCIHWFNPMVWVMFLLLNRDIELACDETVVHILGEHRKSAYAHALIDMEIQKAGIMPLCNNFSRNAIEERIRAIMKTKKASLLMAALAAVLIVAVTACFATSGAADKEKSQSIGATLSAQDLEQLLALKFAGYEKMSISEYQTKAWKAIDTVNYQELLERISKNSSFYEQKDNDSAASFFFYVLEPLTAEKWQERKFEGYAQTNYKEAWENAVLEYSFTIAITNPQTLTVGEYNETRLGIRNELNELVKNKTLTQLQDENAMNSIIRSELEEIQQRYNSDKLQIALEYAYRPLSQPNASTAAKIPIQAQGEQEYSSATAEDYRSLLALKTPDYQTMSVSDFNQGLIEWANEDYERAERIAADHARSNYAIPLSKEEQSFIELTVWASGMENAELVRSHHLSEPEQNPIAAIELPDKEKYVENKISAWCSGAYRFSYHMENKNTLSIGERDHHLAQLLSEIQTLWNTTEIEDLLKMNKSGLEARLREIAARNSNEKIKFSIVEGQVYFEHAKEQSSEVSIPQEQLLEISISSAAVDFMQAKDNQDIYADYNAKHYDVSIEKRASLVSVDIQSLTKNNNASPVKLYIPKQYRQYIRIDVRNGAIEGKSLFVDSNITAAIENSNLELVFPAAFTGSFQADVKESNINFISENNYKNFDIDIVSYGAIVEVPNSFKKAGNIYSYSNGNKNAKLSLTLDEYSMAEFQPSLPYS